MLNAPQDGIADDTGASQPSATAFLVLLMVVMVAGGLYFFYDRLQTRALAEENSRLVVTQVMQFPAVVRSGMARLQADGVPLDKIDFSPESKGERAVFHGKGGGVRYQMPPEGLLQDGRWRFKTVTAAGEGWFIAGIGSDEAGGKDVFAYLQGLPREFCERLNQSLGLPAMPKVESVMIDLATAGAADGTAGLNAWTFAANSRPVGADGKTPTPPAACVKNGNEGMYIFYHLLAAQ
ncbi:MAG: hypothetical protein H3C49_10635 [Alphaproteobacteria bacterium]|nr:hypothetical protein [Alphaproteobacteria bacterium]